MAHTHVGARFSLTRSSASGLRTAARVDSLDVAESMNAVGLEVRSIRGTALEVTRAEVTGDLELADLRAETRDGPALSLRAVAIGGDLHLQRMTIRRAASAPTPGTARPHAVGLRSVAIDGRLLVDRLPGAGTEPHERWSVHDVTYAGNPFGPTATVPSSTTQHPSDVAPPATPSADHGASAHGVKELTAFLRHGTTEYAAQAYRFAAGQASAAGHRAEAQRLMRAQRRHQLAPRTAGGPGAGFFARSWGGISRVTVGYGYRPWYALIWLAFTLALAGVLATTLGAGELGVVAQHPAAPVEPCTAGQQWIPAARTSIPLLSATGKTCVPVTVPAEAVAHALQLAGWAFTTLFVAGFTGIIRRE